jgi:hypothetical protein
MKSRTAILEKEPNYLRLNMTNVACFADVAEIILASVLST